MNFEPDDPRLTAYALGELDGADLREMEAHLMEDPAARRVVDEIRASAQMLTAGFGQETVAGLSEKQRAAIVSSKKVVRMHARKEVSKAASRGWKLGWPAAIGGLAALVALSVFTYIRGGADNALSSLGYTKRIAAVQNAKIPEPDAQRTVDYSRAKSGYDAGDQFEEINTISPDSKSAFANVNDEWQRKRSSSESHLKASEAMKPLGSKKELPVITEPKVPSNEGSKKSTPPVIIDDNFQTIRTPAPKEEPKKGPVTKSEIRPGEVDGEGGFDTKLISEIGKSANNLKTNEALDDYRNERNPATKKKRRVRDEDPDIDFDVSRSKQTGRTSTATVEKAAESKAATEGIERAGIDFRKEHREAMMNADQPAARPDPNKPLNPLGYAERPPQEPQRQDELRYTERYRSYIPPVYPLPPSGEEYARIHDNAFLDTGVLEHRLSTFAADVDTASYSNVRRFLNQNQLPPADAVRVEEMVNYFKYDYTAPANGKPFNVFMEVARCPWNANHKLARIGIKAVELTNAQRPASNLVFLIDVSGSMDGPKRLPLVKSGLAELVKKMDGNDRVSIVTYADGARLVLGPTPCNDQRRIIEVIDSLKASGSTNGGDGIQQAYTLAQNSKIAGGVNRVIMATDGDFNVGITDKEQLTRFIEGHAKNGIFLTVLGYGMGNIKDATLEQLANRGNGNYAYIDDAQESQKVLVDQMSGTLVTVAKDVKLQVEFNPARVRAHRLIGYENRKLAHADFNNDRKDAGEIGAGHTVTALYEIVPTRTGAALANVDPLKYLPVDEALANSKDELLTLKVRYKLHNEETSSLLEFPIVDQAQEYTQATQDFKFASAVAAFGMLLRGSPYRGGATFEDVLREASSSEKGIQERREFIELVRRAQAMSGRR